MLGFSLFCFSTWLSQLDETKSLGLPSVDHGSNVISVFEPWQYYLILFYVCFPRGWRGLVGGLHHKLVCKIFSLLFQVSFICVHLMVISNSKHRSVEFLSWASSSSKSLQHSLAPRVLFSGPLNAWLSVLCCQTHPTNASTLKTSQHARLFMQPLPTESTALELEPCRAKRGKQKQDIPPFFSFFRGPLTILFIRKRDFLLVISIAMFQN